MLMFLLAVQTQAEEIDTGSLIDLPLEDLMNIPVSGSLTELDPRKTPVSVTTITAEDIAVTPARNLLDLIEIYVPGAMWLSSSSGPLLAIRGVIADRNYKYMVLVNGIRVNNGIQIGAATELSMWDVGDIEKVEIIRGPGSVTYGPGAIGGVINITTKNASTAQGVQTQAFYWNKYISRGGNISVGMPGKEKEPAIYGFFSMTRSQGYRPEVWMTNGVDVYYIGSPFNWRHDPQSYFGNFWNDPQYKAYTEVDFKNGWRFWARYTDSLIPNNTTSSRQMDLRGWPANANLMDLIKPVDFYGIQDRQFISALEYKLKLNEDFDLQTTFSYTSTELKTVDKWITASKPPSGIYNNTEDNLRNIGIWATEDRFFNRIQINYNPKTMWKAAIGTEFSYTSFGPGWHQDAESGFRINNMVSSTSSKGYGNVNKTLYIPLGNGWNVHQHAIFGEVNAELTEKLSVLLSARVDKHSYTDYLFSPRGALSYELFQDHYLKFVVQRSQRINTEDELFRSDRLDLPSNPERLDSYEMMYHIYAQNGVTFKGGAFYNDQEVMAFNSTTSRTDTIGQLKTWGFELEAAYEKKDFNLGINHAYVKQIDWELEEGLTTSGISYSDYYYATTRKISGVTYPIVLTSTGNDLNNCADHITKLFSNIKFMDGKLLLHGDIKALWSMPGNQNGFRMLENAAQTQPVNTAAIGPLEDMGAYDLMINGNASISYMLTKQSSISLFVQNIPIYDTTKRYIYDTGIKTWQVERVGWIKEPMAVGVKFMARF